MTFPTIPTGGRVVTGVQTGTSGTRTFPSLTGLTKNSGDLLIAIVVAYQSSGTANAVWSSWGGGFTEFVDQSSTTTMAIGCAYKFSTGSETGTFTVTQAATVTGEAAFILLSIPGAHDTTPPEGGTIANHTTSTADPPALNPAGWGTEDTLWIAVAGGGETATTGSFLGVGTPGPTNYTDTAVTAISADVVGGVNAGVAFRLLNAASEDAGSWTTMDNSSARNSALLLAVRPSAVTDVTLTETGTGDDALSVSAEIPLAETGSGADDLTVAADIPLTETGTGEDDLQVQAEGAGPDPNSYLSGALGNGPMY